MKGLAEEQKQVEVQRLTEREALEERMGRIGYKIAVIIFRSGGGGEKMAEEMRVPFLGKVPIDPVICEDSDRGISFIISRPESPSTKALKSIVEELKEQLKKRREEK